MKEIRNTEENSFALGWSQVTVGNMQVIKNRIMHAFGINSRASWSSRVRGLYNLTPAERMAVEIIFADYGITRVWGLAPIVDETNVRKS